MNSIFHRISVRKYEDRPVEKEKIMEILKAGLQAPSACNQQPWEFFVVTDKEKIQKRPERIGWNPHEITTSSEPDTPGS